MSQQPLECQGGVQINTATSPSNGTGILSVDLPNGPKPGTIWAVDAISALIYDPAGGSTSPGSAAWPSGIYLVPISAPLPENVFSGSPFGTDGQASPSALGLQLENENDYIVLVTTAGASAMAIASSVAKPILVPSGYTLRAVFVNAVGNMNTTAVAYITAQLRILQQQ